MVLDKNMKQEIPYRKDFIHHQKSKLSEGIREIVFGAEDGMVSTLGALTGIAIGTSNHFTVILAGLVIVAVESTGMSVGSYLSNKSAKEVDQRKLNEEKEEIKKYPEAEKKELVELYIQDGWPVDLAGTMAETASHNDDLMLKEMAYRELAVSPDKKYTPISNTLFMFFSYILGGMIPVSPYFFLPIEKAILVSVAVTFVGLFSLGIATTILTKRNWLKAGLEMVTLASIAASIGYTIGLVADKLA